jgi:hypothetical protein
MPPTTLCSAVIILAGLVLFTQAAVAQAEVPVSDPVESGQPQPKTTKQTTTPEDQRGTEQLPLTVKVLPNPRSQTEIAEEKRSSDEHAANERGLITATWILAGFTLLLALVAGAQVALFFWQLRLMRAGIADTKSAVYAAREGALAARDQANTAHVAMIDGQRAYVYPERVHWEYEGRLATMSIVAWKFFVHWRNWGNTPTKHAVQCSYETISTAEALPDGFDFAAVENPVELGQNVSFAPKAIIHGTHHRIPVYILQQIKDGNAFLYIWGWADYNDVFEGTTRRRTEFCFGVEVRGDVRSEKCQFAFPRYGPYNGTDDECSRQPVPYQNDP